MVNHRRFRDESSELLKENLMFSKIVEVVQTWIKDVPADVLSSKKTLATIAAVGSLMAVNMKYALIAFAIWMVCQTAIDITKINRGLKG